MKRSTLTLALAWGSSLICQGQYCTREYIQANDSHYISRVRINMIDHSSGHSAYSNFTSEGTALMQAKTYTMTLSTTGQNDVGVYVDWNVDGDFADANESVFYAPDTTGTLEFTLKVPADAHFGNTRLRVVCQWQGLKGLDGGALAPCGPPGPVTSQWGETEDYTLNIGSIPLPVTLVHWEATSAEWGNALAWTTAQEAGSHSFEVQRSADGQQWHSIGTVPAQGHSSTPQHYSLHDAQGLPRSLYRLKQHDINGNTVISTIAQPQRLTPHQEGFLVYPQPASQHLYIQHTSTPVSQLNASLFTLHGQLVGHWSLQHTTTAFSFAVGHLKAGTYLLVLQSPEGPPHQQTVMIY